MQEYKKVEKTGFPPCPVFLILFEILCQVIHESLLFLLSELGTMVNHAIHRGFPLVGCFMSARDPGS